MAFYAKTSMDAILIIPCDQIILIVRTSMDPMIASPLQASLLVTMVLLSTLTNASPILVVSMPFAQIPRVLTYVNVILVTLVTDLFALTLMNVFNHLVG